MTIRSGNFLVTGALALATEPTSCRERRRARQAQRTTMTCSNDLAGWQGQRSAANLRYSALMPSCGAWWHSTAVSWDWCCSRLWRVSTVWVQADQGDVEEFCCRRGWMSGAIAVLLPFRQACWREEDCVVSSMS